MSINIKNNSYFRLIKLQWTTAIIQLLTQEFMFVLVAPANPLVRIEVLRNTPLYTNTDVTRLAYPSPWLAPVWHFTFNMCTFSLTSVWVIIMIGMLCLRGYKFSFYQCIYFVFHCCLHAYYTNFNRIRVKRDINLTKDVNFYLLMPNLH